MHGHGEFDIAFEQQDDALAGGYTVGDQQRRQRVNAAVKLFVAQAPIAADQRRLARQALRGSLEGLVQQHRVRPG